MKDVDWSKAPEDATHYAYHKVWVCDFVKRISGQGCMYWNGRAWFETNISGFTLIKLPEQDGCKNIPEDDNISFDSEKVSSNGIVNVLSRVSNYGVSGKLSGLPEDMIGKRLEITVKVIHDPIEDKAKELYKLATGDDYIDSDIKDEYYQACYDLAEKGVSL